MDRINRYYITHVCIDTHIIYYTCIICKYFDYRSAASSRIDVRSRSYNIIRIYYRNVVNESSRGWNDPNDQSLRLLMLKNNKSKSLLQSLCKRIVVCRIQLVGYIFFSQSDEIKIRFGWKEKCGWRGKSHVKLLNRPPRIR